MSDKIVNHFVLADGSTAKYDAGSLLNLDDTVSLAGYAPDAKAVGDRISKLSKIEKTSFEESKTNSILHIKDGSDDVPAINFTANFEPLQDGTGAPSVDNQRNITNISSVDIIKTGKNMLNPEKLVMVNNGWNARYDIRLNKGELYSISVQSVFPSINKGCSVSLINKSGELEEINLYQFGDTLYSLSFKPAEDVVGVWFSFKQGGDKTAYFSDSKFQLEKGSPSTYEEYYGVNKNILIDSSLPLFYGGEWDITGGTIKYEWKYLILSDSANWVKSGNRYRVAAYDAIQLQSINDALGVICNRYPTVSPAQTYMGVTGISLNTSDGSIFVADTQYTTLDAFKESLVSSPLQVAYLLATSATYQTNTDVVTTMFGINNIWTDSAVSISIKYNPNSNLFVENYEPRKTVFFDDFNNPTINKNNWTVSTGKLSNPAQNVNYASENNVTIENSMLRIKCKKETIDDRSFTCGSLHSAGKFEFGINSEMSARIRFSSFGDGVWASFWFCGDEVSENGVNPWPVKGEVDVFECNGSGNNFTTQACVHWGVDSSHVSSLTPIPMGVPYNDEGWHIWTFKWLENYVEFLVDDDVVKQIPTSSFINTSNYNAFTDQGNKFAIHLFLLADTRAITENTPDEMNMYVDWIKCTSLIENDNPALLQFANESIQTSQEYIYPNVLTDYNSCDKTVKFTTLDNDVILYSPTSAEANRFETISNGTTKLIATNRNGVFDVCTITVEGK